MTQSPSARAPEMGQREDQRSLRRSKVTAAPTNLKIQTGEAPQSKMPESSSGVCVNAPTGLKKCVATITRAARVTLSVAQTSS